MIEFAIKADDTSVRLMLDQLPQKLKTALSARIAILTAELLAQVRAGEPTGRTGRLRTLTRRFVDERENWVRGRVRVLGPGGRGHNVAAAALEYGARGSFPVKAYRRGRGRVSAYRRRANIAERRFLRGPAASMRAKVLAELQQALSAAVAGNQE